MNGNYNRYDENEYDSIPMTALNSKQEMRRMRRRLFYVLILTIIVFSFAAVCFFAFFRIREIEVSDNFRYQKDEILALTGIEKGANIYGFSIDEVRDRVEKKLPYIAEINIKRNLPSGIEISVKEREAVMYTSVGNDVFLLSSDLDVLERLNSAVMLDKDEHIVYLDFGTNNVRKCITGEKIAFFDERTVDAVAELFSELEGTELFAHVMTITAKSRFDMSFRYETRYTVYLGNIKDCGAKLSFAEGIIEKLYDDAVGTIDVSQTKYASFSPE